jgi:hypothetical protein
MIPIWDVVPLQVTPELYSVGLSNIGFDYTQICKLVNPQHNKICGCSDRYPVYAFYRHSVGMWHVTAKYNKMIVVQ